MAEPLIGNSIESHPQTIYHYCGVQAFKGIVESKCIWLSDVRTCNDYMENNWLKQKYDLKIDELVGQDSSPFHQALAAEKKKRNYDEYLAFVACFSTEPDVLSQWRAYADDGAGFAIGFDPDSFGFDQSLSGYGGDRASTHALVPIVYDEEKQDELIERVIDHYRKKSSSGDSNIEEIAQRCYFNLQMASITCKNPAFAEEKEWRIVYRPIIQRLGSGVDVIGGTTGIAFRISGSALVSYFKLQLPNKTGRPIKEVVLGPKHSQNRESDSVLWFLEANNVGLQIKTSKATYR